MKIFYRMIHSLAKAYFRLFYHHKVFGAHYLPTGPCLLAPNHASFFDPPLVAISCNEEIHFLARGSLFKNGLFNKFISKLNAYPVTGTVQDISSIRLIIKLLKENKKVVIFPEGKRSKDGTILPIKPGIGLLISHSQSPIIPIYLHGTYDIWPTNKIFPHLCGHTACVFGSPLYWHTYQNLSKKQAQEKLSKDLQYSLKSLQKWYLDGAKGNPP